MIDAVTVCLAGISFASAGIAAHALHARRKVEHHLKAMHQFACAQAHDFEKLSAEITRFREREQRRQRQRVEAGRKSARLSRERAEARRAEAAERTIAAARGGNFRPRDEVVAGIRKS